MQQGAGHLKASFVDGGSRSANSAGSLMCTPPLPSGTCLYVLYGFYFLEYLWFYGWFIGADGTSNVPVGSNLSFYLWAMNKAARWYCPPSFQSPAVDYVMWRNHLSASE